LAVYIDSVNPHLFKWWGFFLVFIGSYIAVNIKQFRKKFLNSGTVLYSFFPMYAVKYRQKGGRKMIIILIYMALGYWATGRTIYADRILIGSSTAIFGRKLCMGFLFGWALIPWAIIKLFIGG
jgi:hypothetical protein